MTDRPRALSDMGPVDWKTFTINVSATGHLVASARAIDEPTRPDRRR